MRSEALVFAVVAGFLTAAALVYGVWTGAGPGGTEWAGTMTLLLAGGFCGMCAGYFGFVARRITPRPEDRPDAEPADAAGVVGFFSPGSYWPVGVGASAAVAAAGIVVWQWWLVVAGLAGVLATVGGLLTEYYTGTRRSLR